MDALFPWRSKPYTSDAMHATLLRLAAASTDVSGEGAATDVDTGAGAGMRPHVHMRGELEALASKYEYADFGSLDLDTATLGFATWTMLPHELRAEPAWSV